MYGPRLNRRSVTVLAAILTLASTTALAGQSSGSIGFVARVVESACSLEAGHASTVSIGEAISIGIGRCSYSEGGTSRASVRVTTTEAAAGVVALENAKVVARGGGNQLSQSPVPIGANGYAVQVGTRLVGQAAPTQLAQARLNLEVTYK